MCKKQLIENIKNDPQYKNYFEYEKWLQTATYR
jgi:hypothetical protein